MTGDACLSSASFRGVQGARENQDDDLRRRIARRQASAAMEGPEGTAKEKGGSETRPYKKRFTKTGPEVPYSFIASLTSARVRWATTRARAEPASMISLIRSGLPTSSLRRSCIGPR